MSHQYPVGSLVMNGSGDIYMVVEHRGKDKYGVWCYYRNGLKKNVIVGTRLSHVFPQTGYEFPENNLLPISADMALKHMASNNPNVEIEP